MISVTNWSDVKEWRWPDFAPSEMACKGDGSLTVDEDFMDRLQKLRAMVGFPLPVASGYRSPAYNAKVSDTGDDGPHTKGLAADLRVVGAQAYAVIQAATQLGFTGIGISQKGDPTKRFIHLDCAPTTPSGPRPWVWTYNV